MRDEVVSERYSHAVFELASRQKSAREAGEELTNVLQVVKETPRLTQYLDNPRVPRENKVALLRKAFGGKLSKLATNFLLLLIKKNRWGYFPDVVRIYQALLDRYEGREKASLVTAVPVTQETEAEVSRKLSVLTGKKIELRTVVNPAIIGGAAVYLSGIVIDGSLRAGLKSLKEKLFTVRVH
jgi:F-type H+-transporting ATPase subunit delta